MCGGGGGGVEELGYMIAIIYCFSLAKVLNAWTLITHLKGNKLSLNCALKLISAMT